MIEFGAFELNMDPKNFYKFTNNSTHVNKVLKEKLPDVMDMLLTFSHFTYEASERKLMVTDLQGALVVKDRLYVMLTDPAVHTQIMALTLGGMGNRGTVGVRDFFKHQHPSCNAYCDALGLTRDYSDDSL